jgi:hypothetical protein
MRWTAFVQVRVRRRRRDTWQMPLDDRCGFLSASHIAHMDGLDPNSGCNKLGQSPASRLRLLPAQRR